MLVLVHFPILAALNVLVNVRPVTENQAGPACRTAANWIPDLLPVLLLNWFVHCEAVGSHSTLTVPNLSDLICAQRILTGRSWFHRYRRDCVASGFLIAHASDLETVRRLCPGR